MPYLVERIEKNVTTRAVASPPFGPGFPADLAAQAAWMDVIGSGIKDHGDDYCEFVLLDSEGNEISRRRIAGY